MSSSKPPKGLLGRSRRLIQMSSQVVLKEVGNQLTHKLSQAEETRQKAIQIKNQIEQAHIIVKQLRHLRGAAMKVGQWMSLEGKDYFPPEVIRVLETLHDQSITMKWEDTEKILKKEWGSLFKEVQELSHKPIAAASIGQVHQGKINNEQVAIKVQFPGISESIHSDLKILKKTFGVLIRFTKKNIEMDSVFEELQNVLIQEVDYEHEAQSLKKYREFAQELEGVRVPLVFEQFSTRHVLTMSFEKGIRISDWMKQSPSHEDRVRYADRFLRLYLREFCSWGFVQTDPNPGNFFIDLEKDELVCLDLGAIKTYDSGFRGKYGHLVEAALNQDLKALRVSALELGLLDERESVEAFELLFEIVSSAVLPLNQNQFDYKDSSYPDRLQKLLRKFIQVLEYSPPPKLLIFLHRKLGGIYQILKTLEVTMDTSVYVKLFFEYLEESTDQKYIIKE